MLLLEPKLVILDEIDSGVDVDAIKVICNNINENINNETSLIIITHYPRILQYLKPDFVHIMNDGKLIKTGGLELVEQLEEHGYEFFK
jgi:Fe-S cluster assembly ATP-binding protein